MNHNDWMAAYEDAKNYVLANPNADKVLVVRYLHARDLLMPITMIYRICQKLRSDLNKPENW